MIYDKRYSVSKPSRQRLKLSGFKGYDRDKTVSVLPCDYTGKSFNFGFEHGTLVDGAGALYLKGIRKGSSVEEDLPPYREAEGGHKIFIFKSDVEEDNYTDIMLLHYEGASALSMGKYMDEWYEMGAPLESSFTIGINVMDKNGTMVFLMVETRRGEMYVFYGARLDRLDSKKSVYTMCKHAERVFAVKIDETNKVVYSDALDIDNWDVSLDAGGYIVFDRELGKIQKLMSFNDYLYVFFEYGIYRVSASGDQLSFTVKRLYTACSLIFPDTVVEAGDRIIFTAGDGIYAFDGYDVTRISKCVNHILHTHMTGLTAAYCKHKYYLSLKYDESAEHIGEENDCMAVVNLIDGSVELSRGFNVYNMATLPTDRQNLVVGVTVAVNRLLEVRDRYGRFLDQDLQKTWEIENIDMGKPGSLKIIRSVESNSSAPYTMGFVNEKGEKCEVLLEAGETQKQVGISGKLFCIYIVCNASGIVIRSPYLTVDFYGGGNEL